MLFHLFFELKSEIPPLNVFRYVSFRIIAATLTALLISFVLYPWFIKRLKSKQIGQVIREELNRIEPVLKDGGYIPGCDHGVPSDISWPNFLDYARLLAQMTGWL